MFHAAGRKLPKMNYPICVRIGDHTKCTYDETAAWDFR